MLCRKFTCKCHPSRPLTHMTHMPKPQPLKTTPEKDKEDECEPRRPLRDLPILPKPLTLKIQPKKDKEDEWVPIPVPEQNFTYEDGLDTDDECTGYVPYKKGKIQY